MHGTDLITVSRLKAWRKCTRLHRLQYMEGWRPTVESNALRFGTLFHVGAEAFWRAIGAAVEPAQATAIACNAIKITPCDDETLKARAIGVMMEYQTRQWPDVANFEVVAVEQPFACDLINPQTMASSKTYRLAGKVDLILRRRSNGRVVLVEHKTTTDDISDEGAHYFKKLAMDSQLTIYVVGAESLGFQVEEIIYDVVARSDMELKKATPVEQRKYTKTDGRLYANQREFDESIDEYRGRVWIAIQENPARYFRRVETSRLDDQVRDGLLDTWAEARMIREAELAGRAPRNPDACTQFGTCAFFDHCAHGVDLATSTIYRRVESVHPELSVHAAPRVGA